MTEKYLKAIANNTYFIGWLLIAIIVILLIKL